MTRLSFSIPARTSLVAGVVAVTALAACGGPHGADAPADASVKAFCEVVGDLDTSNARKLVEDLADTGTPRDIPEDARAGFEVMIDKATADDISAADQAKVTAFIAYVATTCAAQ